MSPHKLSLRGLFKHVTYSYLSKYVTSTGHTQTKPLYLQPQENKLVLPLLKLYNPFQLQNKTKLQLFNDILIYNKQHHALFNEYVLSLCHPNTSVKEYFSLNTLAEQLVWLASSCKKPIQIELLCSLLNAGQSNNYLNKLYTKYATSSGLQIISRIINNPILGTQPNITGKTHKDIYNSCVDLFHRKKLMLKNTLTTFYNTIFDLPLPLEKDPFIKDNLIKSCLHCHHKELPTKIKELKSSSFPTLLKKLETFYFPVFGLSYEVSISTNVTLYDQNYNVFQKYC